MNAYVYFSEANRVKKFSRAWFIVVVIRLLGKTEWPHVSFGNQHNTISPSIAGDVVHDTSSYVSRRKELRWMVVVPTKMEYVSSLDHVESCRVSAIPTFIRWLTRIPIPTKDCVQRTKRFLASSGIFVPASVTTTNQLWDWLRSEGYEFIDITGETFPCSFPTL